MRKIEKFNEFLFNNEEKIIIEMIEKAESSPSSDLNLISNRKEYKDVIKIGIKVIPYLLERNLIIWSNGLSELTGNNISSSEYSSSERVEYWKKWAFDNGFQKLIYKRKNIKL